MKNKLIDIKLLKFIIVGIANTAFSAVIMFVLYNFAGFGYWGSSSVSYILGSVLSFVLNKRFTFQNEGHLLTTSIKFIVNVAICYSLAYTIAKPAVSILLGKVLLSQSSIEQISMVFGMCLFTALNYIGQRYFAFK